MPTPRLRLALAAALLSVPLSAQDDAEPAVTRHDVRVDERVTLHVAERGEGDAVVLLAGGPGFAGSTLTGLFEHVAGTRRAILPDARGTGRSAIEPFDASLFSLDASVADLEAVRTALDVDTWTVAGHSWGGVVAMAYAAEHPDRVERLVLIDPGGLTSSFLRTYQTNLMRRLDDEARAALMSLRPDDQSFDAYAELARESNRLMADAMVAVPEAAETLREQLGPEHFEPRVSLAMQPSLAQLDLRDAVSAFEGPVLVIQGQQDPIGRRSVDAIVEAFDDARLEVLPSVGHWPQLEDPDALAATIDAFLAEPGDV